MKRKLSSKQKKALEKADARWNLFTGAVRSGKTIATFLLMIKRLKNLPEGRRAIIGKTETTIMRNILDPLQDFIGTKYISDIEGKKREATIFGKKLYCIGANDKRATKKLKGTGFQYVLGDEITTWPKGFFNMLKSRIDKKNSKFDGTTNPESPNHWLKKDMIDRKNELNIYHLHFTLDDNPFLANEVVSELKKEYTGVWYQRYIKGKWTKAEGTIYDNFNKNNIVSELPKRFSQFWIGGDYGITNPTVFLLVGLGADEKFYILNEYIHEGGKEGASSKTDKEYSNDLKDFLKQLADKYDQKDIYLKPEWIWIDPSAASLIEQLYRDRQNCPAFRRVHQANNEVINGIRRISTLVETDKLKIYEGCEVTINEFRSYSWDKKAQEKGDDKPKKTNDHSMDAMRYVFNGIYKSGIYKRIVSG